MNKWFYVVPVVIYLVIPIILIIGIVFSHNKKSWKFRYLIYLFLFFFGMFLGGTFQNEYVEDPQRQLCTADRAKRLLGYATMLREGETQKVIGYLDVMISSHLISSAWERDMKTLPPETMGAWQKAKVYYDKYEPIPLQYGIDRITDVRNQLKLVPWSERENARRDFESKYKTATLLTAPKLEISEWIGPSFSLDQLKGNVVLLDFWGLSCKPCIASLPKVQKLHEKFKDNAFTVIAIHSWGDHTEEVSKFIKDNNYTFTVAIDSKLTADSYGVIGIPSYYLIDKNGLLVWGPKPYVPSEEQIEELLNNSNNSD